MNAQDNADVANPYSAPTARVAEAVTTNAGMVKADRLTRLFAVLLDSVILVVPILLAIALPAYQDYTRRAAGGAAGASPMPVAMLAIIGVAVLAFVAYQFYLLWKNGQTLGKKIMKVRIVRTDGSRAGIGRILGLRYFVPGLIGAIPLLGPLFSLIDPLFIFAEEKRCLHDMIADTIVVNA